MTHTEKLLDAYAYMYGWLSSEMEFAARESHSMPANEAAAHVKERIAAADAMLAERKAAALEESK